MRHIHAREAIMMMMMLLNIRAYSIINEKIILFPISDDFLHCLDVCT